MKVTLLTDESPEDLNRRILKTCFVAARGCYSPLAAIDLWEKNPSEKKMIALMDEIYKSGHWSVFRHGNLSFSIEGISRTCSHQLVRHTAGINFEQQSQRYVKMHEASIVVPPSIKNNPEAMTEYQSAIDTCQDIYDHLITMGIDPEDARFILPGGTQTNLVMTINLNALINLMSERLCTLAQWEIRQLCSQIRVETTKALPWTKPYLVIKCMRLGYCPEIRNKDQHCKVRPYRDNSTV